MTATTSHPPLSTSNDSRPATAAADPWPWTASMNYVLWLRGLLHLAQVTETEFLAFMQATQAWDASQRSLEIVAAVAPAKLRSAYDDWPDLLVQFTQRKKGAQP